MAIAGGWCCRAPVAAVVGTISIEVVVVVCAVRCAGPVYGSRPPPAARVMRCDRDYSYVHTGRSRFVQARGLCWGGMSHGEGHTHILAISCTTHMGDGGGLEPTPDLVLALAAEALAALGGIELDSPRTL